MGGIAEDRLADPAWIDGVEVEKDSVTLLENCRMNVGEGKDDEALARKYAALCDVFVMDAFGTAHRAQASTHGVIRYSFRAQVKREAAYPYELGYSRRVTVTVRG